VADTGRSDHGPQKTFEGTAFVSGSESISQRQSEQAALKSLNRQSGGSPRRESNMTCIVDASAWSLAGRGSGF